MVGGWKRVTAWSLVAFSFFAWIIGYLNFELSMLAITSFVAGCAAITAIWWQRVSAMIITAMCLVWTITFVPYGISIASAIAAGALTVGFGLIAWTTTSSLGRYNLAGPGLLVLGNLWYLVDNAVLAWTPGFAIGNVTFLMATGLLVWLAWQAEMGTVAPAATPVTSGKTGTKPRRARHNG